DFDDSSVYSISEGEGDTHQSISVMVQDTPIEETVFMAIEDVESDDNSEEEESPPSHYAFMYHPGSPIKIAEMLATKGNFGEVSLERSQVRVSPWTFRGGNKIGAGVGFNP
ncbi:hypothetical protein Tco_1573786, partial [Tanacetum coccineum]